MAFAGINYLAIVSAAVVAWLAGAAWYMSFGKVWTAANGMTPEQMHADRNRPGAYLPFLYVFVCDLIMAWMLAGVLAHLGAGQVTLKNGIITGAFLWFGFVITTMVANNTFARRDNRLLLIDGGHWLVILVLIGAVIGAIGV
jgi:hypothetical protein